VKIQNYSRVRLLVDSYSQEGVVTGLIGYVIEVYPDDKYEVEFSDKHGITIAQIVVDSNEITIEENTNSGGFE
jgi:hypothetical protein